MKRERLYLLDSIRGFALINMIAYHALYDVVYIFGHPITWYESEIGYIWQQSICWCFILLSGVCFSLGKHPVKRGATIFAMGCLISIITALVMPQQKVRFGILSFIGIAMIITQLLVPLLKKNTAVCWIVWKPFLVFDDKAGAVGSTWNRRLSADFAADRFVSKQIFVSTWLSVQRIFLQRLFFADSVDFSVLDRCVSVVLWKEAFVIESILSKNTAVPLGWTVQPLDIHGPSAGRLRSIACSAYHFKVKKKQPRGTESSGLFW